MKDLDRNALLFVALLATSANVSICASGCRQTPSSDLEVNADTRDLGNGFTVNSIGANGIRLNGIRLNGIRLNGIRLNGSPLDGIQLDSIMLDGRPLDAVSLDGLWLHDVAFHALTSDGTLLQGMLLDGLKLSLLHMSGQPLDAAQTADAAVLLGHIVACALPAGQCTTLYDANDNPTSLCGVDGLDPGWSSGAADMTRSGDMGVCVLDRAQQAGDPVLHTPILVDQFKKLFEYMVSCALPENDTLVMLDESGLPMTLFGDLGLAPEWKTAPLSTAGAHLVSACLAARANGRGKPVLISVRGPALPPPPALERQVFQHHEGAFWGDLFTDDESIYTCSVAGDGPSGRSCTGAGCGFVDMGACADVCAQQDTDTRAYSGCGEATPGALFNTFLNIDRDIEMPGYGFCVRQGDDSVLCVGLNDKGQMGNGTITKQGSSSASFTDLRTLVADRESTCLVQQSGTVACWGSNKNGEVDIELPDVTVLSPYALTSLGEDTIAMSMGQYHACALQSSGHVLCWGKADFTATNNGSQSGTAPTQVLLDGVVSLTSSRSGRHICAIRVDGTIWCWGNNTYGQLGVGTTTDLAVPAQALATDAVEVCGGQQFTCARASDGAVSCWGRNHKGQLGDGTKLDSLLPVTTALPLPARQIDCGAAHACAVLDDGSAWCWGDNAHGALGDGTIGDASSPVQSRRAGATQADSSPLQGVRSLKTGNDHTCAFLQDGTIWCFGRNDYEQLGNDSVGAMATVAVPMLWHHCGDGVCDAAMNESYGTCAADC